MSTTSYSAGSKAFGFCDRCGWRWPLSELKAEWYNRKERSNRVCPDCWEPDHPQLQVGLQPVDDPKPLHNPRPDSSLPSSNSIFNWNPVGDGKGGYTKTMEAKGLIGTVTVITS